MTPTPFDALLGPPTAAPLPLDFYAREPMERVRLILARGGTLRPNAHHEAARDVHDRDGVYRGTITAMMVIDWKGEQG